MLVVSSIKWVSVRDRLPEDHQRVLIWAENKSKDPLEHIEVDWLETWNDKRFFAENLGRVTHWAEINEVDTNQLIPPGVSI